MLVVPAAPKEPKKNKQKKPLKYCEIQHCIPITESMAKDKKEYVT